MKKNYKEKEHIIDETLRLLAERYPIGLYEYLFKYQTEMYDELDLKVNEVKQQIQEELHAV